MFSCWCNFTHRHPDLRCSQGLKSLFDKFSELEASVPRIKTSTGYVVANLVIQDVVDIKLVAEYLKEGRLFPLFFLVLQQCVKIKNKEWLMEKFERSGIKMKLMMPGGVLGRVQDDGGKGCIICPFLLKFVQQL